MVFDSVIDGSKNRQSSEKPALSLGEAIGLLEEKSKSISSLLRDLGNLSGTKSELEAPSRHKEMELDQKKLELEASKNTLSWKTTLPLRKPFQGHSLVDDQRVNSWVALIVSAGVK